MKVSVAIITYNHEKFIEQAIDSILMQQVNFDYEIVIGEDCSTDSTRDLVINCQNQHPDKIRLLLPEKNLGMLRNFVQTLTACQGEYIALLEGDDYWTSVDKLQKQVSFLDRHPEYAICFHNVTKVYEDESSGPEEYLVCNEKQILTLEDLLVGNLIPTCSVMFRSRLFRKFPDWFFTLKMGDWPTHIFNAQYGKIRYINEVMGAHRFHQRGVWSSQTPSWQLEGDIQMLENMNVYFKFKYNKLIQYTSLKKYWYLVMVYLKNRDFANAKTSAKKCLSECVFNKHLSNKQRLSMLFVFYAQALYKLIRLMSNFIKKKLAIV